MTASTYPPSLAFGRRSLSPLVCLLLCLSSVPDVVLAAAPPSRQQTDKSAPASHPALIQAKRLIDKGQSEEAITVLRRFLETAPKPDLLDDTYLLLSAALYEAQQYGEALKYLHTLQAEFPNSEVSDRGKLLLARTHAAMGNPDLAFPILTGIRTLSTDENSKRDAVHISGELYIQKKEYTRAIQAWLDEISLASEEQAGEIRTRINELLRASYDIKMLERVRDAYPRSYPGDVASVRLIELHAGRGEDHYAARQIQQFLSRYPSHPYAAKAEEILSSLQVRLKSHQFLIAAVLPHGGKLGPFASDVLTGVQLAVETNGSLPGAPSIGLLVKDFEFDRPSSLEDLTDLLSNDQPIAVIGPLLSKNLPVLAELTERSHIPLLTPTATLPNVRRLGNSVFSTALTFQLQARRIATYATGEQGYRRFCILYPDTAYGREMANSFAHEIRLHDGEIIAAESYKEGESDISQQLKRMKAEDLKKYGLAVPVDPAKLGGKTTKMDKKILYTPGFDAVFIPGRAADVGLIAAQLNFHDMRVPFLGSNGWNAPDFARTADQSIDGSVFVDGFFAESPNPNVQDFVERYKKRFQTSPTLFAMQGYDAARFVIEAIRKGASSGEAVRDFLVSQTDLPAVGGPAAFLPDGTLNRPLFLIQVKRGHFTQLD
ncbi:putative Extracellular ligand-binding receptor [Nitrospira sp. KM1]|uniref:penicillin-binding protein activator n=1 Tax=Nitrospira sp. KM1 TaxID=1936990 RepID=UPI0013A76D2F|nr:penicillin-binding protein activator [Nitrospira sp. KM1]BCA54413.1 putative Extracellular ligand-binding receptor [Nitrospira sp. KM1]